jgi:hypothetical protein
MMIYERKLRPGSGKPIYGLECCKGLHLDTDFLEMANKYRERLMNEEVKKSNYHKEIEMKKCYICKSKENLHTHHIEEQHLADDEGFIGNIYKNNYFNLVVLCDDCHHLIHNNTYKITGWKITSRGVKLIWKKSK